MKKVERLKKKAKSLRAMAGFFTKYSDELDDRADEIEDEISQSTDGGVRKIK